MLPPCWRRHPLNPQPHLDTLKTSGKKLQGRNSPYFLLSLSTKLEMSIVPSLPFTTTSSHGWSTLFHWIQFFCFCCWHFSSNTARSGTDELFTKVGARNWKKLSEKLTKHASSQVHLSSMEMWESYKHSYSTAEYLSKSVNILGLPFHGHRENADESRGNYLSTCDFFLKIRP